MSVTYRSASFSRLRSGRWGVLVEGRGAADLRGEVVAVSRRDGEEKVVRLTEVQQDFGESALYAFEDRTFEAASRGTAVVQSVSCEHRGRDLVDREQEHAQLTESMRASAPRHLAAIAAGTVTAAVVAAVDAGGTLIFNGERWVVSSLAEERRAHRVAVQAWQRAHGVVDDGIVGPATGAAARAARSMPPPWLRDDVTGASFPLGPGLPRAAVRALLVHCERLGLDDVPVWSDEQSRGFLGLGSGVDHALAQLEWFSERAGARVELRVWDFVLSWYARPQDLAAEARATAPEPLTESLTEVACYEPTGEPCVGCGEGLEHDFCPSERAPLTLAERAYAHESRWYEHVKYNSARAEVWKVNLDRALRDPPPLVRDGRGRAEGPVFERYRALLLARVEREVPRLDAPRSALRLGLPSAWWVEAAAEAYRQSSGGGQ